MESAVGDVLKSKGLSISVYEDLTGGLLAEALQQANLAGFKEGIISGSDSLDHIFALVNDNRSGPSGDDAAVTGRLAQAVRVWSGADVGLAMHGVVDDQAQRENLSSGRTYVSLATKDGVVNKYYEFAGRGRPDRMRAIMNALEFLRLTLLGM
jgi:nicotinamide mononucleotide (NMN) deamidase PncC